MKNIVDLRGKRIFVTGASSGIGRACAVMAAELGARVILNGRREDALAETLRMCPGDGHTSVAGDITDESFVAGLAERTGPIDGLVHAAGVCSICPLGVVPRAQLEAAVKTNYYAFVELVKCYSRSQFHGDGFSAVAVSSVSASAGWAGGAAYCGSKGAVSAAARALAVELAPKGIRVNTVSPSNIKTPMLSAAADLGKQPLGVGLPEQVAAPVCFLLSDAASFITGVDLPVDGGYLAQ